VKAFATTSPYPVISLAEAWRCVAAHIHPLAPRRLVIEELVQGVGPAGSGYVLAEDIVATENIPPFPASSMDGYAVIAGDPAATRRVLGEQEAGSMVAARVLPGTALRIMTGAPLPEGADAVIPVEDTSESDGWMQARRGVSPGENVRPVGSDLAAGELVLSSGLPLGPAEIGLLAAVGHGAALVHPCPRVVILATGNELAPPGEPLQPGQIHDSNSYALAAAVAGAGGRVVFADRVADTEAALRAALSRALAGSDLVITSGGVSMGTRDLIKPLLEELGVVHFGRVAIKPGKPLTFATVGDTAIFGLPGFPVSSLVTFEIVVRPALRVLAGHRALWRPETQARLRHLLRHAPDRTEFQRAVVTREQDGNWASTTGAQVSSRLTSLVGANALLVIPQGVGDLPEGATVRALMIAQPEVEEGGW